MIDRLRHAIKHWRMLFQQAIIPLWLNADERQYLRLINKSQFFDRGFYRSQHPLLHPIHLHFAERHYIRWGENAGFYPSEGFSPTAYRRLNPDLFPAERAGQLILNRPLYNYLTVGHAEKRSCIEPNPVLRATLGQLVSSRAPASRWAVAIHVYYPELWPEIYQAVKASNIELDWFITITDQGEVSLDLKKKIEAEVPNANVWIMINRGRDIHPWVALINSGLLDAYDAVCKLHTKKSPHLSDGDDWRSKLISDLLPENKASVILGRFMSTDDAGLLVSADHILKGEQWWGQNKEKAIQLLSRLNIDPNSAELQFPSGSIYWVKASVIERIKSLELDVVDFGQESGATDGTTAHAFERILGYLCADAGLHIQGVYSESRQQSMHLFVHIPKTAGTSFRGSLEEAVGSARIAYDYGLKSPLTSPEVLTLQRSGAPGAKHILDACADAGYQWITGHFHAGRYVPPLKPSNVITFLREPSERVFSEYLHKKRHNHLGTSFLEYIAQHGNRQAKLLSGLSISSIGFIGLTERYEDSLRLLDYLYGLNLKVRRSNKAPLFSPSFLKCSAEEREQCRKMNHDDYLLYEGAVKLFDDRIRLMNENQPIALGWFNRIESNRLRGQVAWHPRFEHGDHPLSLNIRVNGRAQVWDSNLSDYENIKLDLELAPDEEVAIEVESTGQLLFRQPVGDPQSDNA